MKEQKYYVAFDGSKQRNMVNRLNEIKNRLVREGRYIDAVQEPIFKICNAKTKKFKIV